MRRSYLLIGLAAACSPSSPQAGATSPLGQAADTADRDCRVILRGVADSLADFDVRKDTGPGALLYRADGGAWTAADGLAIAGAPGWYQRYRVRLPEVSREVELVPYAALAGGARLFDHNRHPGDLESYALTAPPAFSDDGACLEHAQPRAELDFTMPWATAQHGALVGGGHVTVNYAMGRLTNCRATNGGARFWSLDASVRFQPSGLVSTGSLVASNGSDVSSIPFEADIPEGSTSAELWFHNYTPGQCDAYDSDFGQNYHFHVGGVQPKVGWAGNLGGSWSRDCQHVDGLAEPEIIDEFVRERACTFVDAEVWVPGLTDAAEQHPEQIAARVSYQKDGGAPVTAWLDFVERVGNNFRYRWSLPYELHALTDWSKVSYQIGFSTDGNSFTEVGPRTILRQ